MRLDSLGQAPPRLTKRKGVETRTAPANMANGHTVVTTSVIGASPVEEERRP